MNKHKTEQTNQTTEAKHKFPLLISYINTNYLNNQQVTNPLCSFSVDIYISVIIKIYKILYIIHLHVNRIKLFAYWINI